MAPIVKHCILLSILCCAPVAVAQAGAPTGPASASTGKLVPSPVPNAATQVETAAEGLAELRRLEKRTRFSNEDIKVARGLREMMGPLDAQSAAAIAQCHAQPNQAELNQLEYAWSLEKSRLAPWKSRAEAKAKQLVSAEARATSIIESMAAHHKALAADEVKGVVLDNLVDALRKAKETRQELRRRKSAVISFQNHLAEASSLVDSVAEAIEQHRPKLRTSIRRTAPPLWRHVPGAEDLRQVPARLREASANALQFGTSMLGRIVLHALFGLTLCAWLLLRRRGTEPRSRGDGQALARPFSAALLCFAVSTPLFYLVPPFVKAGLLALAFLAAFRQLPPSRHTRSLAPIGVPILVLEIARLVAPSANMENWILAAELLFTVFAAVLILIGARGEKSMREKASWFALVLSSVGLVALVAGWVPLGHLLGMAVLTAVFVGIVAAGTSAAVIGIFHVALDAPFARHSHLIRDGRSLLTLWASRVVRSVAVLFWLHLVLNALGVASDLKQATLELGSAGLKAGSLDVTLGDVSKFFLGILLAVVAASVVRRVMQAEVLPRTPMVPGAQHAASSTVYYLLLFAGFFLALSAAGINVSNLTFVVGALGVGIGFGLQNVVSNFVSGLILLFGRPVEVGDRIEVGGTFGAVERIGFRSSTLRTVQGAEFIVPNADLISGQVVNWTHSDEKRRIDVDIGVAYGTDPDRVIALLLELATNDERLLREPAPAALFLAHGDSSLDFQLRVWTDSFDEWVAIKSDLTLAMNRALAKQSIEIPFPQRDLHLKSLPKAIAGAVASATRKPPKAERPEKGKPDKLR